MIMKASQSFSCQIFVFHTALGGGLAYGVSSVLVGHPIDTIKNKMQAQEGYEAKDALRTMFTTLRTQGILGLYRGALPQFIGSMCFKSAQFTGYHSTYNSSFMDGSFGRYELPLTGGLQVRVVISGIVAGLSRAALETPIAGLLEDSPTGNKGLEHSRNHRSKGDNTESNPSTSSLLYLSRESLSLSM
jgi:hypothetical protein